METTTGLTLEPRVIERIAQVNRHLDAMLVERMGWGPDAEVEVGHTAMSFTRALATLLQADRVWIDGGSGLSFGGVLPGGIQFGMIARHRPSQHAEHVFRPVEWTFHS